MFEEEKKLTTLATANNTQQIFDFVENTALQLGFSTKFVAKLLVVCDEMFSNIAKFAYSNEDEDGDVTVSVAPSTNKDSLRIKFIDNGMPFNPLKFTKQDKTLPIDKRPVGKMGIGIVRELSKELDYEYTNNQNILSIIMEV